MVKPGNEADDAPQGGAGAPVSGDATPQVRQHAIHCALWPAPGSHLRVYAQALLRRPRALAATRRDGAIWAHFIVGTPRNIDILLRALLLELHPTLPPSHTCLYMK
jgi:hypothetical protein